MSVALLFDGGADTDCSSRLTLPETTPETALIDFWREAYILWSAWITFGTLAEHSSSISLLSSNSSFFSIISTHVEKVFFMELEKRSTWSGQG